MHAQMHIMIIHKHKEVSYCKKKLSVLLPPFVSLLAFSSSLKVLLSDFSMKLPVV